MQRFQENGSGHFSGDSYLIQYYSINAMLAVVIQRHVGKNTTVLKEKSIEELAWLACGCIHINC